MTEEFQLPSWLANGEPIPDELLAKRSYAASSRAHGIGVDEDDDDDDDDPTDSYRPSSFYGFSFIDLSGSSEDTWSVRSSNTPSLVNATIRDEIKTCVDNLHSCLHQFREMNEHFTQTQLEIDLEIDQSVQQLISDLLDRVETPVIIEEPESEQQLTTPEHPSLDYNLLNELLTKKLSLHEYLVLLDRLVDNNILHLSSKTAEDLSNEIVLLADEIEHYRTMITSEQSLDLDQNIFHRTFDNQYHQQFLANTQSNYSVLSFLQQSSSMDMSLFVTADFSSQMQSTLFTSTVQQQQQSSSNGGKAADVGQWEECHSMDRWFGFCLGPFLRTIFSKLENMLQNSLHVNLLLTGIIARLAHYSQPLLRSLLLNHSLVLETNIKSLFQVLRSIWFIWKRRSFLSLSLADPRQS